MTDAVRRIADCAPGRRVLVELPIAPKAAEAAGPSMADVALGILQRDAARDREAIDNQAAATAKLEAAMQAMEATMQSMITAQKSIAESVIQLAAIMRQPVRPLYDAKGILIGAQRVEKL